MRRIAIGLAAGVAIWVGSAVAAEAQTIQIQPVGPTAISAGQSFSTYCASITPGSTNVFDVQLQIYVQVPGGDPVLVKTCNTIQYSTTGTLSFKKTVGLTALNLVPGDVVIFQLNCWWDPNGQMTSNSYSVTVGS